MRPEEVKIGQTVFVKNPWADQGSIPPPREIISGTIEHINEGNARRACWVSGIGRWLFPEALHLTREEAAKVTAPTVPAHNFVATLAANVDNDRLSDEDFRQFVRNSLPLVRELFVEPLSVA